MQQESRDASPENDPADLARAMSDPKSKTHWLQPTGAAILVAIAVAWVQSPVLECQALSFDDNEYLTVNPLVTHPSWENTWRFTREVLEPSTVGGYYQPLAMISLMIDHAAGGRPDNLRPFHRTGLILHAIAAALVVILLFQLFGHVAVAAFAGLAFGLHPVATEVIPWLAQRKTLLATVFALGAVIAYVSWTRRRGAWRYVVALILYLLALLSKPTALPLVAVFIILDWWPLSRLNKKTILEKLPVVAIAGIFAVITVVSQARTGGADSPVDYAFWRPLLIIGFATSFYLRQLIWPAQWPEYYVFPDPFTWSNPVILTYVASTVALVTVLVVTLKYSRAWIAGALMFLALLSPTLGVIGFTDVIAANRFLYLPMIVLLIPVCHVLARRLAIQKTPIRRLHEGATGVLSAKAGRRRSVDPGKSARSQDNRRSAWLVVFVLAGLVVCAAESIASRRALVPWRDTLSLFAHLSEAAPTAAKVRYTYGNALGDVGRWQEAVAEYEAAIARRPAYDQAHNNLAITLDALGQHDRATLHFELAISLNPNNARARNSYGAVLLHRGEVDRAIDLLREAHRIDPTLSDAPFNLGVALMDKRDWSAAADAFEDVLRLVPDDIQALARLAYVYEQLNRPEAAIAQFEKVLVLNPAHKIAKERLERLKRPVRP